MESISLGGLVQICQAFGPFGIVVLIWYFDMRNVRKILTSYKEDMSEIRRMYENNVKLVDHYEDLAKDLKDLIVLNTQTMTTLVDNVRQNQYCPAARVDKRHIETGRQEEVGA